MKRKVWLYIGIGVIIFMLGGVLLSDDDDNSTSATTVSQPTSETVAQNASIPAETSPQVKEESDDTMPDMTEFTKEFSALQKKLKAQIPDRTRAEEFSSHSEQLYNSMTPEMYAIIRSLPDFSGMSYEEINFYTTLVQSGKPYQKYPYK